MDYEKSVELTGDPRKAIELAQTTLVQSGYKILDLSDTSISARHEGGFARTQSGSPMYAASPITVTVSNHRLVATAQFEGIRKVRKFVLVSELSMSSIHGKPNGVSDSRMIPVCSFTVESPNNPEQTREMLLTHRAGPIHTPATLMTARSQWG